MFPSLHGSTTDDTVLPAYAGSAGHHLYAVSGANGALGAGRTAPERHLAKALPGEQYPYAAHKAHGSNEAGSTEEKQE